MKITEMVCRILRVPSVQAKTASSQGSVLVRDRTVLGVTLDEDFVREYLVSEPS